MRQRTDRFIVVFATTTDAMHMEQVCRAQGTPGRLMPIPQQLSAGCGLCWRADIADRGQVEQTMRENACNCEAVHVLKL